MLEKGSKDMKLNKEFTSFKEAGLEGTDVALISNDQTLVN